MPDLPGCSLDNTTLRWETPPKGPKPSGYYILMRETWQSLREKKIFVTGTEITLPYSKDNYFLPAAYRKPQTAYPAPHTNKNA
jgi:hypothetical protein